MADNLSILTNEVNSVSVNITDINGKLLPLLLPIDNIESVRTMSVPFFLKNISTLVAVPPLVFSICNE